MIRRWLMNRRVRRLAERILAHQIVYESQGHRRETIDNSIETAKMFYKRWELFKD